MKKIYIFLFLVFLSFKSHAQNPDAFIMTFEITDLSNTDITIPIIYDLNNNYTVDFGDGTILMNQTSQSGHWYASIGTYTVTVTGNFKRIQFYTIFSIADQSHIKLKTIEQWGSTQWSSMEEAFKNCKNLLINAMDTPDLSQVTNMASMFEGAESLNQSLNNWDVSNITNMSNAFKRTFSFNQPLDNWDVSNVTNMSGMFDYASSFNQNINSWDVSDVTNMSRMFDKATSFNQNINSWDVSDVTNMSGMFDNATSFNQPLNNWDVSNVTNMSEMFNGAASFNQPIGNWDVSDVTNMSKMFYGVPIFNQPLNNWDVSNVTDMSSMFYGVPIFNQPLNNWDVSNVTDMNSMFAQTVLFNQDINDWDVSNVISMHMMFRSATSFNQSLNDWNVSGVTDMGWMFSYASSFNQPIGNWDVSNVIDMRGMFNATPFNQPLNSWNVSNVTDMSSMFSYASSFNQPLNNWDVSNVINMSMMFRNALSFNEPLDDWNISNVTDMSSMLSYASAFDQSLNNWDVSNVTDMNSMFGSASSFSQDISSWNFNNNVYLSGLVASSALDTEKYDLLLLKFAQLGLENKVFVANDMEYCNFFVRNHLKNNLGWTFHGDYQSEDCTYNAVIQGNVLLDENNNGCNINEDVKVNFLLVNADNGTPYYSTSPNNGVYALPLYDDTYTISLQNVPDYFTVTPENYVVSYTGFGNYEQLNFCLTTNQIAQDLNIALLPVTEARPGFEAEYQLVVQNLGTQTVNNVLVNLVFDNTKQTFVTATPAPASTTANELNFEIVSLSPFSNSTINLTMETFTPPTVNGDDILNFTATVSPNTDDYTPNDNTFSLEQIVVNSFDPNDKQVLQGDKIHIDNVDEYLHYLIRFQNTGTASAIHVRIEDELHETLDWNTVQIVGASHNYRVEITEGNQIEFIFQNINLPHEDADEAGSNGFIAYKIKAVEGLEIGDFIIGNEAEIYFDFNLPIITNPTSTEVVLPLPEIEPYGAITLDENNNGCDPEDTKSDFFFVQIDSETSNYSFSPEQGTYTLDFLEEATYTVSLQNVPDYFTVTPESYTLDYQGLGDYEALDFCVTANQIVEDVNIVVLPLNQAQAGSVNHYQIIVQNLGTQTIENLSLSLEFDPTQQTFVTSSPAASSVSSNQLNFTIASLSVLQSTVIFFSMQTFSTPTVNVGDILAFNVWVDSQNDTTPNDNAFVLKQTVTDSSQSNYKQVLQGDKILIEQATEYLHYFISFENTNTTIVANVKIEEYLHETLDWNTFQLLNASHNYQIGITQDNQIKFTFENISLAQGETGFLAYRIKPAHGLQVGDMIIGNEAEIYFDGVLSSITNAADTEIVNPTVGITPTVKHMLWVYPNPTSDVLNIQTKGNIQLEEVQLYNLQGRVLITSKQNLQSINLGGLSSGVYLLSIKTSEGNFSQRVIKK